MRLRNRHNRCLALIPMMVFLSMACMAVPVINKGSTNSVNESEIQDEIMPAENTPAIEEARSDTAPDFENQLPPGYSTLYSVLDDGIIFPVWLDSKCGYINSAGEPVTYFDYDECGEFSEDIAFVQAEAGTRAINSQGNILFEMDYYRIREFSEGLAAFQNESRMWGFLDTSAEVVIQPDYEKVSDFIEGVSVVEAADWKGSIDRQGNIIFDDGYCNFGDFSNGVLVEQCYDPSSEPYAVLIDREGNRFGGDLGEVRDFSQGLAVAEKFMGRGYGYIDTSGEFVIDPRFVEARDFHDGYAAVKEGSSSYYIDTEGNNVFDERYLYTLDFSEGFAWVTLIPTDENWVTGFIDLDGILIASFDSAKMGGRFIDGLSVINRTKDGIPYVIVVDTTGASVFETADFSSCYFDYLGLLNCVIEATEEEFILNREWEVIYPFGYSNE